MSSRGRLVAVNHVELQAPPGIESELRWFYGELMALDEISQADQADDGGDRVAVVLRFKSDRLELRITIMDDAPAWSIAPRAFFAVPSLARVVEVLEDRGYPFAWYHGIPYTDRSISLIDPAGHRVVIRRLWPWALV